MRLANGESWGSYNLSAVATVYHSCYLSNALISRKMASQGSIKYLYSLWCGSEGVGPEFDGVVVAAHEVKTRVAFDFAFVKVPGLSAKIPKRSKGVQVEQS